MILRGALLVLLIAQLGRGGGLNIKMRRVRSLMLSIVPSGPCVLVEVLLVVCCKHLKCYNECECVFCASWSLDALVEVLLVACCKHLKCYNECECVFVLPGPLCCGKTACDHITCCACVCLLSLVLW